jgi:hypothetical protein
MSAAIHRHSPIFFGTHASGVLSFEPDLKHAGGVRTVAAS